MKLIFISEDVICLSSNETPCEMKGKTDDSNSVDDDSWNNEKERAKNDKNDGGISRKIKQCEAIATGNEWV